MKYSLTRSLKIECTLDSSEAIMFTKGGQHSIFIKKSDISDDNEEDLDFDDYDVVEVTFQLEKSQQGRFDFINSEASAHREQWDQIDESEKKSAYERMKSYAEKAKKRGLKGLKGAIIEPMETNN
jgi:hypothetical protein